MAVSLTCLEWLTTWPMWSFIQMAAYPRLFLKITVKRPEVFRPQLQTGTIHLSASPFSWPKRITVQTWGTGKQTTFSGRIWGHFGRAINIGRWRMWIISIIDHTVLVPFFQDSMSIISCIFLKIGNVRQMYYYKCYLIFNVGNHQIMHW